MNRLALHSYRDDPGVPPFPDDKPLIVLDGHCVLCARSAQFVWSHDPSGLIRMTAAQSALGEALFQHYGLKQADYDTVLLIENGNLRVRADAALRILEILKIWTPLVVMARWAPKFLADFAYSRVARNRIRIWGARESCYLPPPDFRDRFL